MSSLQKDLIKKIILFLLLIFGIVELTYMCVTNQVFCNIIFNVIIFGLALLILLGALYGIISMLIKDFKIRGILTKDEYKLFNYYNEIHNKWSITDEEQNKYDRIMERLTENNLKL